MQACKVTVNRADPGSPLPIQVPPNTTVYIDVENQQPNEIVQAVVSNDAVAKPDIGADILTKLATPLASLSLKQAVEGAGGRIESTYSMDLCNVQPQSEKCLKHRQDALYTALVGFYGAYVEPTCLQAYVEYDRSSARCTTKALQSAAAFDAAKAQAIADIDGTLNASLPPPGLAKLDNDVDHMCSVASPANGCKELQSDEERIDALASILATKKAANPNPLVSTRYALIVFQDIVATNLAGYKKGSDRKLTIKVNAIEQIGNTSTSIATVTITWQQANWSLSTGVVLSFLKNKAYANAPLYGPTGAPVTDGGGHTYTYVSLSKTYPGIISPVVFVNYRLHNFQTSQGRWALLFSGGMGANIITKSADFASGPSIQFGNIVFTPAIHYGRQASLANGVHVGDQLGTSPPALPVYNPYKPALGFGLTYRIPLT
jgi:hypothetical protein